MSSSDGVIRGPTLRAQPTRELFDALRDTYGISSQCGATDLGGSSNLNLLVAGSQARYVVRVYRPWVTTARLADIQLVRRSLDQGGVPCPRLVHTRDGDGWTVVGGRAVEVEHYVEHDGYMDSWERLEAGMPWLGRIHALLRPLTVSIDGERAPAANHVESIAARSWVLQGTRRIREWGATPAAMRLADSSEELAQRVEAAEQHLVPHLLRHLVHGDFWDNNVFFRGGRLVLVTDLDFMGERARIDDLALTLYYTNSTFSDDPVSDDCRRRLRVLVDAYDSGLDARLTDVERAALPLALARTPLCFTGMIATVDTEREARKLAAEMMGDVEWALAIAREPGRWQEAFA